MYKTKFYHEKNTKDFIGVGDNYIKQKVTNPRFKSKQFQTNPPKQGQNAGTFDKFPEYKAETFVDKYKPSERKFKNMGFGSNDPERRSEFTIDVLSKQWKEKLKAEICVMKGEIQDNEVEDQDLKTATFQKTFSNPKYFQTMVPFHSHDVGKTAENSTPICNKCSRETFYCRHRVKAEMPETVTELRRPPGVNQAMSPTSYNTYGSWCADDERGPKYSLAKPQAGRIRTTKQFLDQSHLIPGWS